MDDERRHTPIVALTAHALPNEREEFILAGMDDCLTKPVVEAELWRVVARYLEGARLGSAPQLSGEASRR